MKSFLNFLGILIQFLLVTFVLVACFSGLYGLVHVADPAYRRNRPLLKTHAIAWGFTMTGLSFLCVLSFLTISMAFSDHVLPFISLHAEGFVRSLFGIAAILVIGFISCFFTVCD